MTLIAGLGNPGRVYQQNRHNIGFMCVNHLARAASIRLDKKKGQARVGVGNIAGEPVVLARPQTGMNVSGESVAQLAAGLKISPDDIIVIHDDLDLPLGKIRLRKDSSSGGHKGINSIIRHLGSRDFYRVRVGIGRPVIPENSGADKEIEIIDYVLSDFTPAEKQIVDLVIPQVSEAVVCLLTEGLTAAMSRYN